MRDDKFFEDWFRGAGQHATAPTTPCMELARLIATRCYERLASSNDPLHGARVKTSGVHARYAESMQKTVAYEKEDAHRT
jgi:hypothetical protein